MERPYDIDDEDTVHRADGDCAYTRVGDTNADGIHKGLARHGEGLCTECLSVTKRAELLSGAAMQAKLDAGGEA